MEKEIASTLAGAVVAFVPIWFVLMLCVSLAAPFICFSVVRNISRTRRALERIAEALEAGGRPSGGGVLGL